MTYEHTCSCGKPASVHCTFCDEWFCKACYAKRHVDDTHGLSGADDLEALYGPAALQSEHKRGDHITYSPAKGVPTSGTIIWCQAPYRITPYAGIGLRYVVVPDIDTGHVDIVWPDQVILKGAK
jgi:hypothetical protein